MPLSPADPLVQTPLLSPWHLAFKWLTTRSPLTRYSAEEIEYILNLYNDACSVSDTDFMFVVTQMIHETDSLRSVWSNPPNNNPAGIGVTGGLGPDGQPLGQKFETWLEAVQCHVGLILCYRFPAAEGTEAQKRLIRVCTSFRPGAPRGIATTLAELGSKWAADPEYINKLVALSAAIEKV